MGLRLPGCPPHPLFSRTLSLSLGVKLVLSACLCCASTSGLVDSGGPFGSLGGV